MADLTNLNFQGQSRKYSDLETPMLGRINKQKEEDELGKILMDSEKKSSAHSKSSPI